MPKILVVEDDLTVQRILGEALRKRGHELVFASDAASALGIASRERPDLIVLDLVLPDGNGLSVLEGLKNDRALALVPVVVLSASPPDLNRWKALSAGANAYVDKSRGPNALVAAVTDVLHDADAE